MNTKETASKPLHKKKTIKAGLSAVIAATLISTDIKAAYANAVHSSDVQEHISTQAEDGMEVDSRVESFPSHHSVSPAISVQYTTNTHSFLMGTDMDVEFENSKEAQLKFSDAVFFSYKKQFGELLPGLTWAGALGLQGNPASFSTSFKGGGALLFEENLGNIQLGANTGLAYHNGFHTFYPSGNLYAKVTFDKASLTGEISGELPASRLKEELKEEILGQKQVVTPKESEEKNATAVFGARLFFQYALWENLKLDVNVAVSGPSRQNLAIQVGAGLSWSEGKKESSSEKNQD